MKKDPVYLFLQIATFAIFLVMTILVFMQVILRYFFSSPIAWSDEISRLLFIWVSFLGVALAFFSKGHPAITFLIDKLHPAHRQTFDTAVNAMLLAAFLILTYHGVLLCIETHRFASTILRYPMSLQYASLPVCCMFICYKILRDFAQQFRGRAVKGRR